MAVEYVNKEKFLADIRAYRERKQKNPDEQIPNYSAECIMKIANKVANRGNFIGYSYRSEMISDGIYVCLKYFDNFDPDKSTNPFGYFTQVIWFAFLQRIAKEKKQQQIKSKIIAQMPFELFDVQGQDVDENYHHAYAEFLQEHNYVDHPESKKNPKGKKKGEVESSIDDEESPKSRVDMDSIAEIAHINVLDDEDEDS